MRAIASALVAATLFAGTAAAKKPGGAGGAIIAWNDFRRGAADPDVYAQRVDASGRILWLPSGAPLCAARNAQSIPAIAPDSGGGAFFVWKDLRDGDASNVYVQRIRSSAALAIPDTLR